MRSQARRYVDAGIFSLRNRRISLGSDVFSETSDVKKYIPDNCYRENDANGIDAPKFPRIIANRTIFYLEIKGFPLPMR
jgi:hypothetical protein